LDAARSASSIVRQNRATDPQVLIDRIDDLPTLSPVVSGIMRLIDNGDTQAEQIGDLLSTDPALSSRILKVVNSAFYGLPNQVTSIHKAVMMLGFDTVHSLVMSASVVDVMWHAGNTLVDLRLIWERSLFAAVTARKIAHVLDSRNQDECFMAALLMDIGMLAQLKLHGEPYARVIQDELERGQDIVLGEVQDFVVSHERLGQCLLQRWDIPDLLSRPVLYHHDLAGSEHETDEIRAICEITHLARLASNIFYSPNKGAALQDYKDAANRLIAMNPGVVDRFFRSIREEVLEVAEQYGLEIRGLKSYTEILDDANQELAQLNKTYEQLNRELREAQKKAEQLAHSLKQANEKLQRIASVDELTGLYNRRYFEDFFSREFNRCQRYKRPMSCIMLDIDHFKRVNDTYGHQQGDVILKELGERLMTLLRNSDVAVRYGGEEFVVLLPETALYAARITAEKIRRGVASEPFSYKPNQGLPITISLGIAAFDGTHGADTHQELLKQADTMLYKAKEGGRNRCCS
jgi:two-component system, cell cycle response regulator